MQEVDDHNYYEKCIAKVENLKSFRILPNITLSDVLTIQDSITMAKMTSYIDFQEYVKSNDLQIGSL